MSLLLLNSHIYFHVVNKSKTNTIMLFQYLQNLIVKINLFLHYSNKHGYLDIKYFDEYFYSHKHPIHIVPELLKNLVRFAINECCGYHVTSYTKYMMFVNEDSVSFIILSETINGDNIFHGPNNMKKYLFIMQAKFIR